MSPDEAKKYVDLVSPVGASLMARNPKVNDDYPENAALATVPEDARVLLPDVVLSEDRFLDGLTMCDLPRAVEVVGTDGASLVDALRSRRISAVST